MAIYRCKSCGGDLDVQAGVSVVECEYCGNKQTLPKVTDENVQALFNRASFLRQKCEFDKAEKMYEKILEENDQEAEAYWGVILCKFGIEYVEDPASGKRIPTCHRASYDSIVADDYYKQAIKYADALQRPVYEADARTIDEIQKGIIAISKKEDPYDVFICYKETDANGQRTQDSVIANEIYYQLKQEGFKVFYAAITLEDKLGSAYEPIIFAALNSAKVMLAIGTKAEYFQAVWVKNEWSRFLKLMKKDHSKSLFPCYRDMDAYDLPEEFAHLQGLDMSKIGFVNDLVRGIKKLVVKEKPKTAAHTTANPSAAPLLKRVFMFLEDGDFEGADEQCEKVLDLEPENAMAYVGKLMADLKVRRQKDLANQAQPFENNPHYKRAYRFADEELKATLAGYNNAIRKKDADARKEEIYDEAIRAQNEQGDDPDALADAAKKFESIAGYRDAAERAKECAENAKALAYQYGLDAMKKASLREDYEEAAEWFHDVAGYKDADRLRAECAELANKADYEIALDIMTHNLNYAESLTDAARMFEKLGAYSDAKQKAIECHDLAKKAAYNTAVASLKEQAAYANISDKVFDLWDEGKSDEGDALVNTTMQAAGKLRMLANTFGAMGGYLDSKQQKEACLKAAEAVDREVKYIQAVDTEDPHNVTKLTEARDMYRALGEYRDCPELLKKAEAKLSALYAAQAKRIRAEARKKKRKKLIITAAILFLPAIALIITIYDSLIGEPQRYEEALAQLAQGKYDAAYSTLSTLYSNGMSEAGDAIVSSVRDRVVEMVKNGQYEEAYNLVENIDGGYIDLDSSDRLGSIYYAVAVDQLTSKNYAIAYYCFEKVPDYSDSAQKIIDIRTTVIDQAAALAAEGKHKEAYELLVGVGVNSSNFPDGENALNILQALAEGNYKRAVSLGLTEIIIPAGTERIEDRAFQNCATLKSVSIPSSVTEIGVYAFDGCTGLTAINLPNSVASIGEGAIKNCTSLTTIKLPATLEVISSSLLKDCTALTSVTLPAKLTEIGENAFANCSALTAITIPETVTDIKHRAFTGCAFTTLTIPDSVEYMGSYMIENCTALESLTIPFVGEYADTSGTTKLAWLFGGSYASGSNVPESLTTVTVTDTTSLNSSAFSGIVNLTTVNLPDTLLTIGSYAFDGCTALTTITIPSGVTEIGSYAFRKCPITSVTIPSGVTKIESYAFAETKLTNVTVPATVTEIGDHAFSGCAEMQSITVPFIGQYAEEEVGGNKKFAYIFGGTYADGANLPESLTTVVVTGGTSVADSAFYNAKKLTSITLPETVTSIGGSAFRYCEGLTSITIPSKVTSIGGYAFADCINLTGITIPAKVESIGSYAFYNCKLFTSVTVPTSVTEIGSNAFSGCNALESISVPFVGQSADQSSSSSIKFYYIFGSYASSVPASLKQVTVRGGENVPSGAFEGCSNLKKITLPDTILNIRDNAFKNCTNLISINLPKNLKTIGANAFYACTALVSVTLHENVSGIGGGAFEGCSKLYEVRNYSELTVTAGSTALGKVANYAKIVVTDPEAEGVLETVGDFIFYTDSETNTNYLLAYTGSQTDVVLPANYKEGNYWIADGTFRSHPDLTSIVIPDSVEVIGSEAFRDCKALTKVVIGNKVGRIMDSAFYGCNHLTDLTLGNGLFMIYEQAFYGCSALETLTLPDTVTQIKESAFQSCSALSTLKLSANLELIGVNAFRACKALETVQIPAGVTYIGQYAFDGDSKLEEVKFADKDNWYVCTNANEPTNGILLNATDVQNVTGVAGYLTNTYVSRYWIKVS